MPETTLSISRPHTLPGPYKGNRFLFRRIFPAKCAYSGRVTYATPQGHNSTTIFAARLDAIKHRVIYTVLLNRSICRPSDSRVQSVMTITCGPGVFRVRPYKTVCDIVNIWKTHVVRHISKCSQARVTPDRRHRWGPPPLPSMGLIFIEPYTHTGYHYIGLASVVYVIMYAILWPK